MIKNVLFVAIGGSVGAGARYLLSELAKRLNAETLPIGTFIVNVLGCFLIGFLMHFILELKATKGTRLIIITGFLGAFTTFSTYALETMTLFQEGNIKGALMNLLANNVVGFLAVLLGLFLAETLKRTLFYE